MKCLVVLVILSMVLYTPVRVFAEGEGAAPTNADTAAQGVPDGSSSMAREITAGIKSDIRAVFFAGAGGALLGLSTLSFVEKPSEELRRVTYGFAIGAILASIGLLYKVTSKSMDRPVIPKINSMPPGEHYENIEDEYEQEYEDEEEEYYDEDFYGMQNSFYLASVGMNGLKFNLPIFTVNFEKNNGFRVDANIFRMTF